MIEIDEGWFLKSWGIVFGSIDWDVTPFVFEQLYAQMMGWA